MGYWRGNREASSDRAVLDQQGAKSGVDKAQRFGEADHGLGEGEGKGER